MDSPQLGKEAATCRCRLGNKRRGNEKLNDCQLVNGSVACGYLFVKTKHYKLEVKE